MPVSRRQCRRESGEVKEEVIAAALILCAELGHEHSRLGIVNTRRTGIGVRVDCIRTLIEWRMGCVRSRMRQRGINPEFCWPLRSEEHPGKQPTALHTAREVAAASRDLSSVGAAGLTALDAIKSGKPISSDQQSELNSALSDAAKPKAQLLLMSVAPVQRLVEAASQGNPCGPR